MLGRSNRALSLYTWHQLNHPHPHTNKQTPVLNLQQMAAPRLEARGDGFVAVAWEPVEGAEK